MDCRTYEIGSGAENSAGLAMPVLHLPHCGAEHSSYLCFQRNSKGPHAPRAGEETGSHELAYGFCSMSKTT
jgi:hypothetical protein